MVTTFDVVDESHIGLLRGARNMLRRRGKGNILQLRELLVGHGAVPLQ